MSIYFYTSELPRKHSFSYLKLQILETAHLGENFREMRIFASYLKITPERHLKLQKNPKL